MPELEAAAQLKAPVDLVHCKKLLLKQSVAIAVNAPPLKADTEAYPTTSKFVETVAKEESRAPGETVIRVTPSLVMVEVLIVPASKVPEPEAFFRPVMSWLLPVTRPPNAKA